MYSVEEARNKIIKYLQDHGKARWSDLLQLGIPKATLYRALKTLLESGVVRNENRFYVLAEKDYVAIIPMYAKQICEVIECRDVYSLTKDLMSYGEVIRGLEKSNIQFVAAYTKLLDELGQKFLQRMFQLMYGHRGVFTVFVYEVSRIYKGLKIVAGCPEAGIEQLCQPMASAVNMFINTVENLWGLGEDLLNNVEKLGKVLRDHGYEGGIKISLLGLTTVKLDIRELITMGLLSIGQPLQPFAKIFTKIIELGYSYYSTGCRPLGEKEKKEIAEVCLYRPKRESD